jgi:flagellum-specific ATP synthase
VPTDYLQTLSAAIPTAITGSVIRTEGLAASVADFPAPVGAMVEVRRKAGAPIRAEVVGFSDRHTIVLPYEEWTGVTRGDEVRLLRTSREIRVGNELLGRVINAHGEPIDGKAAPFLSQRAAIDAKPPEAMKRPRISEPLTTGIRAIDGLLTCGRGQRMGIFAGSGVGKSVTLGMMARYTSADVNVIGLIGERGREVKEFIERDLGPDGLARSVVIVATSDEPALLRVKAAFTATAIAEFFRDQSRDVLLMMDSVTRFAMAQREIGLAAGEPPTTKGYPPSVFAMLPRLVERSGRGPTGTITAFYSVLVEGDDVNEPVSDTVRGLLDGHCILSRRLAARGQYPAIDVLGSISRLLTDLVTPQTRDAIQLVRELLSTYRENEDLITIGAYRQGSNPLVDLSIAMQGEITNFLRQAIEQRSSVADAQASLQKLAAQCAAARQPRPQPATNGGLR